MQARSEKLGRLKPKTWTCPVCSRQATHYQDSILSAGETAGVAYDDSKTGNYDWQHTVVGFICEARHIFWLDTKDV